jgi:S-formylglutathione hydrolase
MKRTYFLLLLLLLCVFCRHSAAQSLTGTLLNLTVDAPSLSGNILGDSTVQPIAVYLPPSYYSSVKSYPVIYFLPGWSDYVSDWTSTGVYQGFKIQDAMNQLISARSVNELIVVIVNGYNKLGGCFFVNSSVTGNWEDFVVKDVVSYMDTHYRTLRNRDSRAISGLSMGGFGAINIAMRHADVYCAVYALSPGLFAENGLQTCQIFKSTAFIKQFIAKEKELNALAADAAYAAFRTYLQGRLRVNDWDTPFSYSYAAAFSPNPNKNAPFIDYPYSLSGSTLVADSAVLKNYYNGFGGLKEEVKMYKTNLQALKLITMDEGTRDGYVWITNGCIYLSKLLTDENIPHQLVRFDGDHADKAGERFKRFLLPALSNVLVYDAETTTVKSERGHAPHHLLLQNYPNPFNPSTVITYSLPQRSFVVMKIFNVSGKEINMIVNEEQNPGEYRVRFDGHSFPSGMYFIRIEAGSFVDVKKCIFIR